MSLSALAFPSTGSLIGKKPIRKTRIAAHCIQSKAALPVLLSLIVKKLVKWLQYVVEGRGGAKQKQYREKSRDVQTPKQVVLDFDMDKYHIRDISSTTGKHLIDHLSSVPRFFFWSFTLFTRSASLTFDHPKVTLISDCSNQQQPINQSKKCQITQFKFQKLQWEIK